MSTDIEASFMGQFYSIVGDLLDLDMADAVIDVKK